MLATIKKTVEVHISEIVVGDTIVCSDGVERTVSRQNIKYCPFMGKSIFGDCYRLGYKSVVKVLYEKVQA